jgi:Putative MetA-pathway of phenol degradation
MSRYPMLAARHAVAGTRRGRRAGTLRASRPGRGSGARAVLAGGILASVLGMTSRAAGGSLSDVFQQPRFARLGLAPVGAALAATVADTYPVASASSSIVYVYDPTIDAPALRPGLPGPIFGERAETVGKGRVDLTASYSFVRLATINGESLDDLVNQRTVGTRFLFFPVEGGVMLKDGRFTTLLPVHATVDIGVEAHVLSASLTYGVTPDLDVNVTLPVIRTSLDLESTAIIPDPRFPSFALPRGSDIAGTDVLSASATSAGVGDLLLRAKYIVRRGAPADVALGLGLSLPTGDADDFQGTGTTRVLPGVIASRVLGNRVELLANLAMELDANDVARSAVRWALGGTISVLERLAVPIVFLGRHEINAPTDPIRVPFFFQIERSDAVDASVGLRWRFVETALLSANVLVPLNRSGLRPDVVPTVSVEWRF